MHIVLRHFCSLPSLQIYGRRSRARTAYPKAAYRPHGPRGGKETGAPTARGLAKRQHRHDGYGAGGKVFTAPFPASPAQKHRLSPTDRGQPGTFTTSESPSTEASHYDGRWILSGGSGVMVEAVTSSVRRSCVYGEDCKLVGGTEISEFVLTI
jgi:hypothetical protein